MSTPHILYDAPRYQQIYQKTKNIRASQLLLGHSNLDSTARYPGVELDDALDVAENTVVDIHY